MRHAHKPSAVSQGASWRTSGEAEKEDLAFPSAALSTLAAALSTLVAGGTLLEELGGCTAASILRCSAVQSPTCERDGQEAEPGRLGQTVTLLSRALSAHPATTTRVLGSALHQARQFKATPGRVERARRAAAGQPPSHGDPAHTPRTGSPRTLPLMASMLGTPSFCRPCASGLGFLEPSSPASSTLAASSTAPAPAATAPATPAAAFCGGGSGSGWGGQAAVRAGRACNAAGRRTWAGQGRGGAGGKQLAELRPGRQPAWGAHHCHTPG